MSDLPITEQEVNHLMEAPKSIIEEIRWTSKPGREHILEFVVPIKTPNDTIKLQLVANINTKLINFRSQYYIMDP